ncbi:Predicted insulinase-like Zn-dependent peptidase DVU0941 [Olavius algarvensis associated proteobacterium Delta 3]|nr:Predicted insulinase-like Zn-dependent peptidase DVU0941 [Olavius algarvensis associated proteobacterium Delta 3]
MSSLSDPINRHVTPGQTVSGYQVQRVQSLPAIDLTFYELSHINTGARHIHLGCSDTDNCFSVAFKTVPENSTGVAHILEHTVLCGSHKYPVRDPFFSMLKRSLSTFMNAFTASDWTMYPFSTQNQRDYYNLMDVYLDAVFHPRLDELSFKQEGHRMEFDTISPNGTPRDLTYKGVVYNEMKGAMSSPDQVMIRSLLNALFPSSTYRFNSGGDPAVIPRLTYDDLIQFHRHHYHPSNSFFYTYGNLPLAAHLEVIDEKILSQFNRIDPGTEVDPQPRWASPRSVEYTYPLSRSEDPAHKFQACVAWLAADIQDTRNVLVMTLLEQILLGNAASPLRKALIESGLGSALSDGTGYSDEYRDTMFTAGLKDVGAESGAAVEELVFGVLEDLARHGIPSELIESAFHQIEFHLKEKTNHPYPYGLKLLLTVAGGWMHGADPYRILDVDTDLNRIREEMVKGPFLESQLKQFLLENPHHVRFSLVPDLEEEDRKTTETQNELAHIAAHLDNDAIHHIQDDTIVLKRIQETPEDVSVLPTLDLADVPPTVHCVSPTAEPAEVPVFTYEQSTGGIVYFTAAIGTGHLDPVLIPWVPFFCFAFPKIGTVTKSYVEVSRDIDRYTGGIGLSAAARTPFGQTAQCLPFLAFNGKCLERNTDPMMDLLSELILDVAFTDLERLQHLLMEYRAGLESMVIHNGHRLAMSLASRNFSDAMALNELWSGVHQLKHIKEMTETLNGSHLSTISDRLAAIRQRIVFRNNIRAAVIGADAALSKVLPPVSKLYDTLSPLENGGFALPKIDRTDRRSREGWGTSSAVSFVAEAFPTVRMDHPDAPSLSVISKILRSLFLHREIREKGGAYGGFASYSPEDGTFCLASYRDPHIVRTLEVYRRASDFITSGVISNEDIKEAVLQVCSDIDKPDPPGPAARKAFYRSIISLTDGDRLRFKQNLLSLSRERALDVAKTHFSPSSTNHAVAVISSEERLTAANAKLADDPLEIYEI